MNLPVYKVYGSTTNSVGIAISLLHKQILETADEFELLDRCYVLISEQANTSLEKLPLDTYVT